MENLILQQVNKQQLIAEILDGVKDLLEKNRQKTLNEKKNWTAQETADYCKVTKVTIHDWTKKGILTKHKIGNRIFYKSNEVKAAIYSIKNK